MKNFKRPDRDSSMNEIVKAIHFFAADKRGRVLNDDQIEWLEIKLKEIKRLAILAKKKLRKVNP